ncbi:putative transient receptor potential-gamma protein isoform X2 [Apostichopus japonicus]|uniref:Putative transient receptor potential-gamma protein isoform X2 n=1 Tax=Stichopus japonicus TaxID=307972 RepID=A0A2G8JPM5_STIJA|nr:putative transient receptor potential-gamma protein isoform X2 [Apostichopus japonicus]
MSAINMSYLPADCPDDLKVISGNVTCVLVEHQFWSIGVRMLIMALIIVGEAMWLVYGLYRMGLRMFSRQLWNWINAIQTVFFLISLSAYAIAMIQLGKEKGTVYVYNSTASEMGRVTIPPRFLSSEKHLFETSRAHWALLDSVLVAELAFAIGNILTVLRLLYTLILVDFFGPLVISMFRMLQTVGRFLIVSVLIIVSFALGLTQLFAPYQTLMPCESMDEEQLCGQTDMFDSFRSSLMTLFWSVFGDFAITRLTLPHNLRLISYSGHLMHAVFVVMMTIVVLNMLIATILNVYESIQGNLDQEWKFARTKMLEEFLGRRGNLPAPYNLLPSVRFLWKCLRFCCNFTNKKIRKTKFKFLDSADSFGEYQWSRRYHEPLNESDARQINYKGKHKIVKAVVGRYMNNIFPAIDCTMEHVEGIEQLPSRHVTARRTVPSTTSTDTDKDQLKDSKWLLS